MEGETWVVSAFKTGMKKISLARPNQFLFDEQANVEFRPQSDFNVIHEANNSTTQSPLV